MNAGVPDIWLEDAVQDIAIRVWKSENPNKTVVRRAAIDAARQYGITRRGIDKRCEYFKDHHVKPLSHDTRFVYKMNEDSLINFLMVKFLFDERPFWMTHLRITALKKLLNNEKMTDADCSNLKFLRFFLRNEMNDLQ